MAKRKITKTQRERALVQQQVRRMESRGYRIDDSVKQKIKSGNYQALHALRNNKYAKLFNQSSAEIDGKIVGGSEKRSYERSQSALKAAETRKKRSEPQINVEWKKAPSKEELERELYGETREESRKRELELEEARQREEEARQREEEARQREEASLLEKEEWERRRKKKDAEDKRRAVDISQGEIMYKNITALIDKFPMRDGSNILSRGLKSEINKYGRDAVMAGMANAPVDIVQRAQEIAFYTGDGDALHDAIVAFFDAIVGVIKSQEEAQDIGDYMDEITDMSEP